MRRRIKRRQLIAKRNDLGRRRGTLRFYPLEVGLCLREFGDERVTTRGSQANPKLFFARRFHSKVSAIQLRIASQASSRVTRGPQNIGAIAA